ncbi:hypothetical protein DV735_g2777, partial [Chaetothyriales sp. CBS 134920]
MAAVRFQTGWRRFVPVIGYHHVLMIFIAAAIILLSLLLAGCSSTSPLIPDIYLISLYYHKYAPVFSPTQVDPGVTTAIANVVGNADLTVRVGYFGMCIRSEGSGWMCNTNSTALADLVSVDQDPLNLRLFDNIVLPASADFHVHLRQASLMHTVVSTPQAGGVDTVYVMPNLNPPIDTFLMTLYLNDKITPEVIHAAKASGAIAGVKSYPRGVTTGSDGGVKGVDYSPYYPVFAAMEQAGLVLNLHGECPFADADAGDEEPEAAADDESAVVDVLNAEEKFLPTLREVVTRFPKLKVVLEHVTTRAAVEYVRQLKRDGFDNVRATITAHHLWLTVDDWAGDGLNFCKPVAKREADRRALLRAGLHADGLFFLGSDSAPHLLSRKKGVVGKDGLDKCSAGVFTQPIVTQLVLEAWEAAVRRGLLREEDVKRPGVVEGFLGVWGREFYGVEQSQRRIRIRAGDETVKEILRVEGEDRNDGIVPFWIGKKIYSLEWVE